MRGTANWVVLCLGSESQFYFPLLLLLLNSFTLRCLRVGTWNALDTGRARSAFTGTDSARKALLEPEKVSGIAAAVLLLPPAARWAGRGPAGSPAPAAAARGWVAAGMGLATIL